MSTGNRRRVSAADVAARAGASRSAVSLVLNGRGDGNVAAALQESIREAVRELGYVPQSVGQSLRSRSTRTVGVITDEIVTSPFAGQIISGAGSLARDYGFMTMVADSEGDDALAAEMSEVFFARGADALMMATGGLVTVDPASSLFALPAVLANCEDPQGRVPAVVADEARGSHLAVEHLLHLGHRDIVLLSGTADSPATPRRRAGFDAALAEAGLSGRAVGCGWEIDDGYRAARELLTSPQPPTAVLASNDRTAVGVLLAAAHCGVSVPGQLSVVGVDDQAHVAGRVVPALTTVALPHRRIGIRAMEILLELLGVTSDSPGRGGPGARTADGAPVGAPDTALETIAPELITRESTGAVPTS